MIRLFLFLFLFDVDDDDDDGTVVVFYGIRWVNGEWRGMVYFDGLIDIFEERERETEIGIWVAILGG